MPSHPDPDLPARIRAGDPETLRVVVHTYLGQVLRAARAAGLDSHAAEDVTQATFATFLERHADFEGRSHVRTWLFGILYRKISETWRAVARDRQMSDIDEVVEKKFKDDGTWLRPPRPVDAEVYERQAMECLDSCLGTLPERQRQAFVLREGEGFTTEEICNILDVSRTHLGVLLFRARNRLRECLESKGVG